MIQITSFISGGLFVAVSLSLGFYLGYRFAIMMIAKGQDQTVSDSKMAKDIARTLQGKPRETRYYPSMTDREADKEDGSVQEKIRNLVHPSAKELEDEE